jgi:hypothetical protein
MFVEPSLLDICLRCCCTFQVLLHEASFCIKIVHPFYLMVGGMFASTSAHEAKLIMVWGGSLQNALETVAWGSVCATNGHIGPKPNPGWPIQ